MIDDKISQSMGVRSLAETQAEDTTEPHENVGSLRGLGSSGEQSQTDEDRQPNAQVLAEPELEKNSQTEGSQTEANDLQIVEGEVRSLSTTNDENLNDIELARSNVQSIIELGDDAVKEMVEIAKQSESPRAFEVVSTLMKTLLDANKEFVNISAQKKLVKDEEQYGRPETNVTNNNLIVSTADLLSMIKGEGNANN